jgi:hypothetical protein
MLQLKGEGHDDLLVEISDMQGRIMVEEKMAASLTALKLNISSLNAGLYVAKIIAPGKVTVLAQRFVDELL